MDDDLPWYQEIVFPALLRGARRTYGQAIRDGLAEAGFEGVPRNGSFVLGSLARSSAPMSEIIAHLGVTKQAAGQLVDVLVTRGYLERSADPDDRRRLTVALTERGRAAAAVARDAVQDIDDGVVAEVGLEAFHQARRVLGAIIEAQDHG